MGGKAGKSSKANKSDGSQIKFLCKICNGRLHVTLSLADEHVKVCQRKAALKAKEHLRRKQQEDVRAQELVDARRGRDN